LTLTLTLTRLSKYSALPTLYNTCSVRSAAAWRYLTLLLLLLLLQLLAMQLGGGAAGC